MAQNAPFIFGAGPNNISPASTSSPAQAHNTHSSVGGTSSSQQITSLQDLHLPFDVSALAGISPQQFQAIVNLVRSGALGPSLIAPESSTAQTATAIPTPAPASRPFNNNVGTFPHTKEIPMEKRREDERLEEGEVDDTAPQARGFLRPPPTGPRDRSYSPRERHEHQAGVTPPLSQQPGMQPQSHAAKDMEYAVVTDERAAMKDEATKSFLLEMVKAGYTYGQLAKELPDARPLRRLFTELDLSIAPDTSVSNLVQVNGTAVARDHRSATDPRQAVAEEQRIPPAVKKPPPVKPAAVDRSEYLARLQAAKNKKPEPVVGQSNTEITTISSLPAETNQPAPQTPGTAQEPRKDGSAVPTVKLGPANKAIKTELVRQKLEALKAQEAARRAAAAGPSKVPDALNTSLTPNLARPQQQETSNPHITLGAGLADILARTEQNDSQNPASGLGSPSLALPSSLQSNISPRSFTPSMPHGGLPGLFMMPQLVQAPALQARTADTTTTATQSRQTHFSPMSTIGNAQTFEVAPATTPVPSSGVRKRPVAADFDDIPDKPLSKRPFGQSRGNSEDESFIIEPSDDEEDDDEDEMETDDSPPRAAMLTKPFRDVPPLRDFPPRPKFQQSSTPSTPGGGISENERLEEKMKAIAELNRMIAERQQRSKTNGKPSTPTSGEGATTIAPVTADSLQSNIAALEPSSTPIMRSAPSLAEANAAENPSDQFPSSLSRDSVSSIKPVPETALARRQEKERLRQRLLELEHMKSKVQNEDAPAAIPNTEIVVSEEAKLSAPGRTSDLPERLPERLTATEMKEAQRQEAEQSTHNNVTPSEDGEITDDGMSDLYEVENPQAPSTFPPDTSHVASTSDQASEHGPTAEIRYFDRTNVAQDLSTSIDLDTHTENKPTQNDMTLLPSDSQMGGGYLQAPPPQEAMLDEQSPSSMDVSSSSDVQYEDEDGEGSMIESDDEEEQFEPESATDSGLDESGRSRSLTQPATYLEATTTYQQDYDSESDGSDSTDVSSEASSRNDEYEPEEPEQKHSKDTAAESEAETQLPENAVESKNGLSEPFNEDSTPKHYFKPYQSALAGFKDYRYHPLFVDTVPHGFRSLTFNHRIDPSKPLCPFEAAGGKCNDRACDSQHFEQMGLSDTHLLETMCSVNVPAHTKEAVDRWKAGLTQVIQDVTSEGLSSDATKIAERIAAYRREFVGDESKILNLG